MRVIAGRDYDWVRCGPNGLVSELWCAYCDYKVTRWRPVGPLGIAKHWVPVSRMHGRMMAHVSWQHRAELERAAQRGRAPRSPLGSPVGT